MAHNWSPLRKRVTLSKGDCLYQDHVTPISSPETPVFKDWARQGAHTSRSFNLKSWTSLKDLLLQSAVRGHLILLCIDSCPWFSPSPCRPYSSAVLPSDSPRPSAHISPSQNLLIEPKLRQLLRKKNSSELPPLFISGTFLLQPRNDL